MSEPDASHREPHETARRDLPPISAAIATMAGGVAALATAITSLAVTGTIGRMQRNHPKAFAIAIGLIVAGSAMLLIAGILAKRPGLRSGLVRAGGVVGVAAAAAALIVGFYFSIKTVGEPERPVVSVTLDPGTMVLTGTAEVERLSSGTPLTVTVDGIVRHGSTLVITQRLAEASVGPDGDGNATKSIVVPVPSGRFDVVGVRATTKDSDKPEDQCGSYPTAPAAKSSKNSGVISAATPRAYGIQTSVAEGTIAPQVKQAKPGTGCQYVSLPVVTKRPGLTVRWVGRGRRALRLSVATPNAALDGTKPGLVHLDVVASTSAGAATLARVVRDAVPPGQVIPDLRVPVPASARSICAWATLDAQPLPSRPSCPLSRSGKLAVAGVSAFQLTGPTGLKEAKAKAKAKAKKKV
jgi:hypothetical protein